VNKKWIAKLLLCPAILFGKEEPNSHPLPIGNFSVPFISQIAPLVGFGQLLIGEKGFLPQLTGSYVQGHNSNANVIAPNVVYGIRDDLSIFLATPFTLKNRAGASHSSGINDVMLQLEYGVYTRNRSDNVFQTTIVANVQFPTGSSSKRPPTGNGSFSYFTGATFSFTSYNWYAFVSAGANLTTSHHGTRFGNSYLYQWGFARYISQLSPKGWIFDVMLEFDGTYSERDKIRGMTNSDSGGNVIIALPSLWLSSKRWIFQWGVGFPLFQNLKGHQDKIRYTINYNLGIAFQF